MICRRIGPSADAAIGKVILIWGWKAYFSDFLACKLTPKGETAMQKPFAICIVVWGIVKIALRVQNTSNNPFLELNNLCERSPCAVRRQQWSDCLDWRNPSKKTVFIQFSLCVEQGILLSYVSEPYAARWGFPHSSSSTDLPSAFYQSSVAVSTAVDSNQSLTAGDDPQGSSLSPFWTIAFELSASCLGLLIEAQEPRMWLRTEQCCFIFNFPIRADPFLLKTGMSMQKCSNRHNGCRSARTMVRLSHH